MNDDDAAANPAESPGQRDDETDRAGESSGSEAPAGPDSSRSSRDDADNDHDAARTQASPEATPHREPIFPDPAGGQSLRPSGAEARQARVGEDPSAGIRRTSVDMPPVADEYEPLPAPTPAPGPLPVTGPPAPTPVPGTATGGRHRAQKRQGRVVTERLKRISPWSVLKMSVIFYFCVGLVFLVSGVLIWQLARTTGFADDTEDFVSELFRYGNCIPEEDLPLGEEAVAHDECGEGEVRVGGFEIDDMALLRAGVILTVVFTCLATLGTTFLALLFNLLSDITGGVRYSVVREPVGTTAGARPGRSPSRSTGRQTRR